MSVCEHNFTFQGVATWPSDRPLPGSCARVRNYADAYYCTKCLDVRLMRHREFGNTYEKVLPGSTQYAKEPR